MNRFVTIFSCLLVAGLFLPDTAVWAQRGHVVRASRVNTSQALRDVIKTPARVSPGPPFAVPNKLLKMGVPPSAADQPAGFVDPVQQSVTGPQAPNVVLSFDGSSDDDNAAVLGYRVVPPDTQGDVGPNHYVQWINSVSEIFNKNGVSISGPFAGNAYFAGMGGDCEGDNSGDPVVLYDEVADRWLVSQFSVAAAPFSMCVAISQTPDPTGAYHQYEFDFGDDMPDYPKLGIWGDSYVMTTRDFYLKQSWAGMSAVAMDRSAMLNGSSASMVRFANAFGGDGYLPADADGAVFGPAIFGGHGGDGDTTFELWELDVDWVNPGAATLTGIPGAAISVYDGNVPSINQPNGQVLDDLSFFTMHRLHVRDFGTHRAMVANHTVEPSPGTAGIRWYEFRNTGGNWTLYQEGTFSPDSKDRWMGSIAINANGDIALGYSRSSSADFPSIYFAGQTADQSGTGVLNVAETLMHAGGGSQSGASRWGDYSMMSVDPADDTFWFTTEYYAATASFDFNTRIGNFELGGGPVNQAPVATITAPADGSSFNLDDPITFTGTAIDTEDGDLSGSLSWSSNVDGSLGSGASITTTLSAGTHTIIASVTDSGGKLGSDQITVSVVGPSATDVHVENIVIGTQGNGKKKNGTATVTIFDDLGNPAAGYTVTGDFGGSFNEAQVGTTNASGQVTLVTAARVNNATVTFCVSNVAGALPYDPNDNTSSGYACGGGGTPTDVHVANISTGSQGVGGGNKVGTATVTIQDDIGGLGAGYMVTGNFSGDISQNGVSGVTAANGTVTLQTTGTARGKVNVSFCVTSISGALTYDPNDNASPSFDCSAAKQGIAAADELPEGYALEQNFPNPFNPSTVFAYSLGEDGPVTLKIYNLLGQEVAAVVDGYQQEGRHEVMYHASQLSAGVYLYVLETAAFVTTKRMTLLK